MLTRSRAKIMSNLLGVIELHMDSLTSLDRTIRASKNPNAYRDKLENVYEAFRIDYGKLNTSLLDPNSGLTVIAVKSIRQEFDAMYFPSFELVSEESVKETTIKPVNAPVQPSFQLPVVKIPVFNGNPFDWANFKALFDSTIHKRTDISGSQKFQLLRTHLSGPPLALISNLEITDEAYVQAYQALVDRFENCRFQANNHLGKLHNLKPAASLDESLHNFVTIFLPSVTAFKNLNIQHLDFCLLNYGLNCLPADTRLSFESSINAEVPTVAQLTQFVNTLQRSREALRSNGNDDATAFETPRLSRTPRIQSNSLAFVKPRFTRGAHTSPRTQRAFLSTENNASLSDRNSCAFCQSSSHSIFTCTDFLLLSVNDRYKQIKRLNKCFACLGNHPRAVCKSTRVCGICRSPVHNTILHVSDTKADPPIKMIPASSPSVSASCSNQPTNVSLSCHLDHQQSLLGTAEVLVFDVCNNLIKLRAVLDPGSQSSLITSEALQYLKLQPKNCNVKLLGLNSIATPIKGMVSLNITSPHHPELTLSTKAMIVPNITGNLPSSPIDSEIVRKFNFATLADPHFDKPRPVQLLLGADLFSDLLTNVSVRHGSPAAIHTTLGWIILGKLPDNGNPLSDSRSDITSLVTAVEPLNDTLHKFWQIEEICEPRISDPDDLICENLFTTTTTRDDSGRFVVAMPFRTGSADLDSNRESAFRIHRSLERRLQAQPTVRNKYNDFMKEYLELSHMEIASSPSAYVIPHHCVFKETSSTTKLRVVFNASAPDVLGNSLNNQLLPGPKLQKDLSDILINFRLHEFVVCSDLKMMYRQILIRPDDRRCQHIFFRENTEDALLEYELRTVTYGLTPSAYLAQRTLLQLVEDEGSDFPLASHAIVNHSYVDDIISGAHSFESASILIRQLIELFSLGGFQLRKWASNDPRLLQDLPESHRETPLQFSDDSSGFKILGLQWNSELDEFSYTITPFQPPFTKRNILSFIARTFDPLGLLAPLVFSMKYFLKLLWEAKLDWDQPIPNELRQIWEEFSKDFPDISSLRIPRFIGSSTSEFRLLGFCDASEKGYAACIYLHVSSSDSAFVRLLKAKSRIAPVKLLSIPRLELCGALLLAKLFKSVNDALLRLPLQSYCLFSDSTIVLSWLRIPPHKLKCFVANRVTKICDLTQVNCWGHINSESNPADLASRGSSPATLLCSDLWWHGPEVFRRPQKCWPASPLIVSATSLPELRTTQVTLISAPISTPYFIEYFRKFSSYNKLLRIIAYIFRFVRACRRIPRFTSRCLTAFELNSATTFCVRTTQQFYFAQEIKLLSHEKPNSLQPLSPFFDDHQILRVGGRLDNSDLKFASAHPFLLPKKCELSTLICDYYHQYALHSGPRTTQAIIQRKFWIIGLRSLLRSRIRNCLRCFRFRAAPVQPLMASLPTSRVSQLRPFQAVGIDYAGPFNVKINNLRNSRSVKGYLCVFVCMCTKAVHLECVSDLTADSFLASFDRFISRRGLPSDVYSDNGTNFVGASNYFQELRLLFQKNSELICNYSATKSIQWHFNPPSAPNFGGLWEAAVKSTKLLLRRVVGDRALTFEEFSTIFARIEAILNSRPLYDFSPDPAEDMKLLTPGHFLIGDSLLQPPEPAVALDITPRTRWIRLRQLVQGFWKLWSHHYLHTLIQRQKWTRASPALTVGQIVLIYGLSTPPSQWPLGRVVELHTGQDGIARVATVQTAFGLFKRPLNKLVVFPSGN